MFIYGERFQHVKHLKKSVENVQNLGSGSVVFAWIRILIRVSNFSGSESGSGFSPRIPNKKRVESIKRKLKSLMTKDRQNEKGNNFFIINHHHWWKILNTEVSGSWEVGSGYGQYQTLSETLAIGKLHFLTIYLILRVIWSNNWASRTN